MSSVQRFRFTPSRLRSVSCPDDRDEVFVRDTDTSDLCFRVRERNGARVERFMFLCRMKGKLVRITIGDPERWLLSEARAEARRLRALVDRGIDPRLDKQEQQEANERKWAQMERERVTLADVWSEYVDARRGDWSDHHLEAHEKAMREPGLKRQRSRKRTVAGPLWPLRDDRLADLTPQRIAKWLGKETKKRPTSTAQAYRLFRACLVWVSEQPKYAGLIEPHALFNKTVRRAVPSPRAKTDSLQREQLRPWFEAVRSWSNPSLSAYLQAALLTGARRGEIAGLRWSDVDFKWRALHLRDKVEGDRTIPLPPYLAHVLASLPRKGPFVFHSARSASGHITDPNHDHNKITEAAGLPRITIHGLRRSFGTLSEWVECPVGVVAQIQGHKPSALAEKHYRQRPLDLLRKWHVRIEGWILEQAGIEQPPADAEPGKLRLVE
ncbi:site-specific integrase [Guyparkeria sp. SCN-R1]|uniref:tyrosine-type recombinase/integrase n=1 Tax=Guyparkeria sp. SCN-R1 TaxID=2341113 RepID=UPI000F64DE37|nr:site-specific integrase [Guyparkeria sp. SCN-R1]RRQ20417.1 site-specific integrase [Guyparkeria sp. SCN-R1]